MLAQLERFASLRVPAISRSCGPCPVELGENLKPFIFAAMPEQKDTNFNSYFKTGFRLEIFEQISRRHCLIVHQIER